MYYDVRPNHINKKRKWVFTPALRAIKLASLCNKTHFIGQLFS
jgi:hypothetical protein